uniref:hypothetical protein n=1 Tax=Streptomyces sp. NBC_01001 TaxID=2903713 RepID=UPI002F90DB62
MAAYWAVVAYPATHRVRLPVIFRTTAHSPCSLRECRAILKLNTFNHSPQYTPAQTRRPGGVETGVTQTGGRKVWVETLRARMPKEQFGPLMEVVREYVKAGGGRFRLGLEPEEKELFTTEVQQQELLNLLGLLGAMEPGHEGRADHVVARLGDGERSKAAMSLVSPDVADDPNELREELVEALAVSAAETTAMMETGGEGKAVPAPVPLPGTTVPPWREGLPATVLALDYQRILGVLGRPGQQPVRDRESVVVLGLEPTPAKVEGVRSKAERLAERGWLVREASGMFSSDDVRLRPGTFLPPS